MNAPAAAPPRHQQAVVISIVVAATAVTACALVAIAWMVGWVPTHGTASQPVAAPAPAAATSPDLALLPGETVVNAEEAKPVTPQYAKPEPGKPVEAPTAAPPKPAVQGQATARPPRPSTPSYQRAPPPPTSFDRSARNFCVNCGTVQSITAFDMGQWEVKVRFEDGSMETLRYPARPALRIGQSVLLEEGRLIPQ